MIVKRIEKDQWLGLSEVAHEAVFGEKWVAGNENPDFALIAVDEENKLISYVTVRELDSISSYMCYGGTFPDSKGQGKSYESFKGFVDFLFQTYRCVVFHTNHDNWPMLKFGIKEKFLINGVSFQNGKLAVEFRKGVSHGT